MNAGMPLQQVKQLLDEEQSEKSALIAQRDILTSRITDLQHMLGTIDELLEGIDMNKPLTPQEAAAKFGSTWRRDWQEEAESRWSGSEAWEQSQRRQANFAESDWESHAEGHQKIKDLLVDVLAQGIDPDSETGREVAAMHREWVSAHYDCSRSRQVLLARGYLHDERFRAAYDGNNEAGDPKNPGATDWLVAAIEADARAHGIDPDTASWD